MSNLSLPIYVISPFITQKKIHCLDSFYVNTLVLFIQFREGRERILIMWISWKIHPWKSLWKKSVSNIFSYLCLGSHPFLWNSKWLVQHGKYRFHGRLASAKSFWKWSKSWLLREKFKLLLFYGTSEITIWLISLHWKGPLDSPLNIDKHQEEIAIPTSKNQIIFIANWVVSFRKLSWVLGNQPLVLLLCFGT